MHKCGALPFILCRNKKMYQILHIKSLEINMTKFQSTGLFPTLGTQPVMSRRDGLIK